MKIVIFSALGGVIIGNKVTLSHGVTILSVGLDTTSYAENAEKKYRDHIRKNVIIGNGTWIAANVTICPGAVIPEKCIIAAGAVVSGFLEEPECMYGGIPAKKIKKI